MPNSEEILLFPPTTNRVARNNDSKPSVLNKVELQITKRCNMNCSFCFADAGEEILIPVDPAKKAIIEAARSGDPRIDLKSVWLTGGEPLVEFETCRTLIECARELGISTGIATNGLLLEKKAESLKQAGLQMVRVSLDATQPSLFDTLRGTHNALPIVRKGIEAGIKNGLQTAIRFTVTNSNASELENVIDLAREMGVNNVEVKAVLPIGRGSASTMLDPNALNRCMKDATEMSTPEMPVQVLCSYLPPCSGFTVDPNYVPCVCAREALYVAVDGRIMPCSYFPQTSSLNIKKDTLLEAWSSNEFSLVRDKRPNACDPCSKWGSCRNGCPAILAHYADSAYETSCFSQAESLRKKYGPAPAGKCVVNG